jgi:hypothetical protein
MRSPLVETVARLAAVEHDGTGLRGFCLEALL